MNKTYSISKLAPNENNAVLQQLNTRAFAKCKRGRRPIINECQWVFVCWKIAVRGLRPRNENCPYVASSWVMEQSMTVPVGPAGGGRSPFIHVVVWNPPPSANLSLRQRVNPPPTRGSGLRQRVIKEQLHRGIQIR